MSADDAWDDLTARVEAWIADDPDPETADELRELLRLAQESPPGLEEGADPDLE